MNEQEIFEATLELETDRRAAYLDEICGSDADLRRRIENLVQFHEMTGDFFETPAAEIVGVVRLPMITEVAGTIIGQYKLLKQVGEGGMGVVYLAEQTRPVERRVALKIIKPGMDTQQVIGRFEAEQQALAMMDHPNIAKVLDVGITDSRRPYFVMELVEGIPITNYCDQQHLTTQERLELFIPVCQAVQHAHQKGIIHRDIKPSNILVTLYDGRPVPKVIDFGVAKAINQKPTEKTVFTQFGQIVGTLEFMSPEQADLSRSDIDTRADVYSLGVLLYELLIGQTPLDRDRLRACAYDELMQIIREEEPPRPSTRLSASDTLPSVAANRRIEPQKLRTLVRGELDWIVMRAIEKDRNRRYESANDFARDVQRFLNDEPVDACPPSTTYRFRKFARRNRVSLLASTAVVLAMIVGTAVSLWQAYRATQALTEVERQKSEVVIQRSLADENFRLARSAVDEFFTKLAESDLSSLREELLESSLKYYQEFVESPTNDPALQADVALAYWRIAQINAGVGRYEVTIEAYHLALAALRENALEDPDDAKCRNDVAKCCYELGSVLRVGGRLREALNCYQQAIENWEALVASAPTEPSYRRSLANSYGWLGKVQTAMGESFAGLHSCQKAVKHMEQFAREDPSAKRYATSLARWHGELAKLQSIIGEGDLTSGSQQKALVIYDDLIGELKSVQCDPRDLAGTYHGLSDLCYHFGRFDDAILNAAKAVEIREEFKTRYQSLKPLLAESYDLLARSQRKTGRRDEALASFGQAAAIREQLVAESPEFIYQGVLADTYQAMGDVCVGSEKLDQAMVMYAKAARRREEFAIRNPGDKRLTSRLSVSYDTLGAVQMQLGKRQEALASYHKVWELRVMIPEERRSAADCGYLGRALYRLGRWEEARHVLEKATELCGDTGPTLRHGFRWWYLVMALARTGEKERARTYFRQLVTEAQSQELTWGRHQWLQSEITGLLELPESPQKEDRKTDHQSSGKLQSVR